MSRFLLTGDKTFLLLRINHKPTNIKNNSFQLVEKYKLLRRGRSRVCCTSSFIVVMVTTTNCSSSVYCHLFTVLSPIWRCLWRITATGWHSQCGVYIFMSLVWSLRWRLLVITVCVFDWRAQLCVTFLQLLSDQIQTSVWRLFIIIINIIISCGNLSWSRRCSPAAVFIKHECDHLESSPHPFCCWLLSNCVLLSSDRVLKCCIEAVVLFTRILKRILG